MKHISTLVIGAGQAGLAISHCLSERSVPHVVLERGEVANSWASERWDSLTLLTPNWQSRLPGYSYSGDNPDGYMSMTEITRYLQAYAVFSAAPIETRTRVLSVSREGHRYHVVTDRGDWRADNVVLASGACNLAQVPELAASLPVDIEQLTPHQYRNPDQLQPGGVLIVGASATGVQLAAEIRKAGHEVMLASGEHIRMPRTYRGHDIQWWMDRAGIQDMTIDEVDDINRARRVPSLQLIGSREHRLLDINALQAMGVEVVGRLAGLRGSELQFSGSLLNCCALSDLKMNRLLKELDAWAEAYDIPGLPAPHRFEPTVLAHPPRLTCSLSEGRIRTVIWATGFKPDFSWLHLPVFNDKGRLQHERGNVAPGLYVLGMPFQCRRKSALIDGVGSDAKAHANHIAGQMNCRAA